MQLPRLLTLAPAVVEAVAALGELQRLMAMMKLQMHELAERQGGRNASCHHQWAEASLHRRGAEGCASHRVPARRDRQSPPVHRGAHANDREEVPLRFR